MESFFLDEFWDPFCCLVLCDQLLFNLGNFDKPAIEATVDKWSLASPAEWVAVLHGTGTQEATSSLKVGLDLLVSVLDVDALVS